MLLLLFIVIVCGIAAWVINSTGLAQPFKNIALGLLLLICVAAFFQIVLGVNTGIPLR